MMKGQMLKKHFKLKIDGMTIVFILLSLLILFFILAPIFMVVFSSSPVILWNTLLEPSVYTSILLTLYAGFVATLIGLLLGVPLAYLLARRQFWGKSYLETFIDIPIVIPHSAAGIALLFVFGRQFLIGNLFGLIGLNFVDSLAGVVIAMLFVSIPFLINSARDAFKSIDIRMEKMARSLGASSWRTFSEISLPLAKRGIISGSVMMWARGIGEFGAVSIIAYYIPFLGGTYSTTPVLVAELFNIYGLNVAIPVTALVIIISLIIFLVLRFFINQGENYD